MRRRAEESALDQAWRLAEQSTPLASAASAMATRSAMHEATEADIAPMWRTLLSADLNDVG